MLPFNSVILMDGEKSLTDVPEDQANHEPRVIT